MPPGPVSTATPSGSASVGVPDVMVLMAYAMSTSDVHIITRTFMTGSSVSLVVVSPGTSSVQAPPAINKATKLDRNQEFDRGVVAIDRRRYP